MRSVTADGREFIGTCEDRTSAIVAAARLAMNRWGAGGMARSWVAMRYHEGMVFQAGGPERSSRVAGSNGRWVAAITAAVFGGTSWAKTRGKTLGVL
jgi:hypothetical protein